MKHGALVLPFWHEYNRLSVELLSLFKWSYFVSLIVITVQKVYFINKKLLKVTKVNKGYKTKHKGFNGYKGRSILHFEAKKRMWHIGYVLYKYFCKIM